MKCYMTFVLIIAILFFQKNIFKYLYMVEMKNFRCKIYEYFSRTLLKCKSNTSKSTKEN